MIVMVLRLLEVQVSSEVVVANSHVMLPVSGPLFLSSSPLLRNGLYLAVVLTRLRLVHSRSSLLGLQLVCQL